MKYWILWRMSSVRVIRNINCLDSSSESIGRVFLVGFLLLGLSGTSSVLAAKPNIILIFIDDLGWADVGCYGNDFVDTPRVDRLAAEGVRFTDFYAAGAVCSPTRCAVQSGQNQARIGITAHIPGHWRPLNVCDYATNNHGVTTRCRYHR
jgi:hypothetical protein